MILNFTPPLLISLLLLATLQLPYPSHASLGKNPQQSSKAGNGVVSVELWCVAKNNAETSALQTALDWACGTGGADCGPIQQGGPCYDLSDIQATASFAFNDYFLKHGLTEDSCYFDNTAALTSLNPSHNNCKFPSSFSVSNGTQTGSSNAIGTSPASADLSGCNRISIAWSLVPLITIHLCWQLHLFIENYRGTFICSRW